MDKQSLLKILGSTTCLVSKGERTRQKLPGIDSLLWGLMLSEADPEVQELDQVDCQFVTVGVNPYQAELQRNAFIKLLDSYPDPEQLSRGPSYKHIAPIVGDEMTALRLFGLGASLGLWEVLLPKDFDIGPELEDEAADLGLVVITSYPREMLKAASG